MTIDNEKPQTRRRFLVAILGGGGHARRSTRGGRGRGRGEKAAASTSSRDAQREVRGRAGGAPRAPAQTTSA